MSARGSDTVVRSLEEFRIEIPSWGFANTGTRFGKFLQPAAAATTEEKFSDAGQVHRVTGVCPRIALHVLWVCPEGINSAKTIAALETKYGLQAGSINTNLLSDQIYKYQLVRNYDPEIRQNALQL